VQDFEKVMQNYVEAYQKLYKRVPTDLRAIDKDWVSVNGARMRITELEYLTRQLTMEYKQLSEKKNIIGRLIKWMKS